MIALPIISGILFGLSLKFNWINAVKAALLCILISTIAVIFAYSKKILQSNQDALLTRYKDKHIDPLISLLNNYNLYTIDGIEWLIDCCNSKKINNNEVSVFKYIKSFFTMIVYPLITLGLGLILKESSIEEVVSFIMLLIELFIMAAVIFTCIKPIISFMLFPDKDIIDYLEDELKYIKTQFNPYE